MNALTAQAKTLVRAKPALVFDAFVNAATMSKFWFTRRDKGLRQGEEVLWYIGTAQDAPAVEVRVLELIPSERIHIRWGQEGQFTQVLWQFDTTPDGHTRLSIEESGFTGSDDEIIDRALDSTGGFNQVVIAVKALLEHGAPINLIADHG